MNFKTTSFICNRITEEKTERLLISCSSLATTQHEARNRACNHGQQPYSQHCHQHRAAQPPAPAVHRLLSPAQTTRFMHAFAKAVNGMASLARLYPLALLYLLLVDGLLVHQAAPWWQLCGAETAALLLGLALAAALPVRWGSR